MVAFFVPGAVVRGGLSSGLLHAWVSVQDSPGHRCILDPCTRNRLPQVQLVGPGDTSYRDEREGAWRPPREDVLAVLFKTLTEGGHDTRVIARRARNTLFPRLHRP